MRRNYQVVLNAMERIVAAFDEEKACVEQARGTWTAGADPSPAPLGKWREDSMADRFFAGREITEAADAPVLADATLPSPAQMAENSGHWVVAVHILTRAVVLERSPADDSGVAKVLDLLAPVVRDELALETGAEWDYPDHHGPLFLLGASLLSDATWAIVGLAPLDQALALMERTIDEALAGQAGSPDAKAITVELVRAFGGTYQCTEPGDVQTLERLGRSPSGNPLVNLIQAWDLCPQDALRLGLITLGALADLARSDPDSAAGQPEVTDERDGPAVPAGLGTTGKDAGAWTDGAAVTAAD